MKKIFFQEKEKKDIMLNLTMVDSNVFDVASVIIPQAVFTHILKQIIDRELYMSMTHWQSSGKSKMRIVITAKNHSVTIQSFVDITLASI